MQRKTFGAGTLVLAAALFVHGQASALPADSADDVCAADADPCEITQPVEVAPNAALDFGLRDVRVRGAGKFDFGTGSGTVRCGDFDASTTAPAIDAVGPVADENGTDSGRVTIVSQASCDESGSEPGRCVVDEDCELGSCSVRRCSARPSLTCIGDASCQGVCGTSRRCTNSSFFVRCSVNSDCDFGVCNPETTCSKLSAGQPRACETATDCDLGACTVGEASITIDAPIAGSSDTPAALVLEAANDVVLKRQVNLASRNGEADGGDLDILAGGDVLLEGQVRANGGAFAQGGVLGIEAEGDVVIDARVVLSGGDFDGGLLDVKAGNDIFLNESVIVDSRAGAGFGGEIYLEAGRDLVVGSGDSSRALRLRASGHTNHENFTGDGGILDFIAGRDVVFGERVRILSFGGTPDGYGGEVFVEGGEFVQFDADVEARSRGLGGDGGFVDLHSAGSLRIGEESRIVLAKGRSPGGDFEIEVVGNVEIAGVVENGPREGSGSFVVDAADLSITGEVDGGRFLNFNVCRFLLESGARLRARGAGSDVNIDVGESAQTMTGSELVAENGDVRFEYRDPAKPPLLLGSVDPTPSYLINTALVGCPVCGNNEIDEDESCDDGNAVSGDGCDSSCLLE